MCSDCADPQEAPLVGIQVTTGFSPGHRGRSGRQLRAGWARGLHCRAPMTGQLVTSSLWLQRHSHMWLSAVPFRPSVTSPGFLQKGPTGSSMARQANVWLGGQVTKQGSGLIWVSGSHTFHELEVLKSPSQPRPMMSWWAVAPQI